MKSTVTLLRNNPERVFVIQVENLDAEVCLRYFSRNDAGEWSEYDGVNDPDLVYSSATVLNEKEANAFRSVILKSNPSLAPIDIN